MSMNLSDIAQKLGCRLDGPGETPIHGIAGIEHAEPGHITFLANRRYFPLLKTTRASAVLVEEGISIERDASLPRLAALRTSNPYLTFAHAIELFYQAPRYAPGFHPTALIAKSAKIGGGAHIGPYCVVGEDAHIGRNAVLHSFVTIYQGARIGDDFFAHSHAVVREFCRIGDRVILQNGAIIGGDGLGFAKRSDGTHYKIVQSGVTVIEDDVEIQTLTSIDRATVGETRVRRGAKIDSLVQVGHACVVGEDNIICAQTGLAGSSILEKNVLLAGQAGVSGHLTIHDGAVIYAQSGIGGDVPAGAVMSGSPAFDAREWLRAITAFQKLPEIWKAVRTLVRQSEEAPPPQ